MEEEVKIQKQGEPETTQSAPSADKRKKLKRYAFLCGGILLSGLLRAVGLHIFVLPNRFAPGGVTGIATLLENFTKISSGYWLLAMNLPLLFASFFLIGKRFGVISSIGIILQSSLLVLFDMIDGFPTYTTYPDLAAIAGGVVCGIGIGLMLKIGGSNGGTDIISTFIYKHFSALNISWFIFTLDSMVVATSFFIYNMDFTPVLLSFAEMFASAKASELILYGFRGGVKFEIITAYPDELAKALLKKLHRGVTMIDVRGAYTGEQKTMLICLVRNSQVSKFQKILANYPDAFAYISSTSDIMGRGFRSDLLP